MWRDRLLQALFVSGISLLALACFLVWRQAQLQAAGLGPQVTIWTAARDLAPDTLIRPEALAPRTVPQSFLLPGTVTNQEQALGKMVVVPVPAGQPLMSYALSQPVLGDPRLRRFDLTGEENVTLPAGLAPGDPGWTWRRARVRRGARRPPSPWGCRRRS